MAREYSEDTQQYIDNEITDIISKRYRHVLDILSSKKELLEKVAARLLDTENCKCS